MSSLDNLITDAKHYQSLTQITSSTDMLNAAKWGNPNLTYLARRYPTEAQEAISIAQTAEKRARDLVVQMSLRMICERLSAALEHSARELIDPSPKTRVLQAGEVLTEQIRDDAQAYLDERSKGKSYSTLYKDLATIEQDVSMAVLGPMIERGEVVQGVVRVWIGQHPRRPASHHDLVVQSVRVEVPA